MIKITSVLLMILMTIPFILAQDGSQGGGGGVAAPAPVVEEVTIAKQVALGKALSDTQYFDTVVDHSDLSSLFDGTVTFGTSTYDTSEVLQMPDRNDPAVATSLTGNEDDFKSNVFVTTARSKLVYKYKFDKTINLSTASTTNPLTIDFLSKKLKVTSVADADTFTVYVGDEQSSKTYNDGDAFIGENETDPDWVWSLAGLSTQGTAQTLGVKNNFRKLSNSDKPMGVGECYTFPNDYLAICLDNLTIADADLKDYRIEAPYWNKPDMTNAIGKAGYESTPSLRIYTSVANGLHLDPYSNLANVNIPIKTQEVWLSLIKEQDLPGLNASSDKKILAVFYNDPSTGQIEYFGGVDPTSPTNEDATLLKINYVNTKDDNIILKYNKGSSATNTLNLTWDINADSTNDLDPSADDIGIVWGISNGNFNKLGTTATTEEAGEIIYGAAEKGIGAKDEDHRTMYGIIIKNPKSNSASERVMLQIPPNQVYANVRIKGKIIAPVEEPKPSLLAILADMEGLVNKIRTTTEYEKQPKRIERILKIIEKQIQDLRKIASATNAQSDSGKRTLTDRIKGIVKRR